MIQWMFMGKKDVEKQTIEDHKPDKNPIEVWRERSRNFTPKQVFAAVQGTLMEEEVDELTAAHRWLYIAT